MSDRWRYRCPQGHTNLRRAGPTNAPHGNGDGHWYCLTCRQRYERVVDLKTGVEVTA